MTSVCNLWVVFIHFDVSWWLSIRFYSFCLSPHSVVHLSILCCCSKHLPQGPQDFHISGQSKLEAGLCQGMWRRQGWLWWGSRRWERVHISEVTRESNRRREASWPASQWTSQVYHVLLSNRLPLNTLPHCLVWGVGIGHFVRSLSLAVPAICSFLFHYSYIP